MESYFESQREHIFKGVQVCVPPPAFSRFATAACRTSSRLSSFPRSS
jgi:hypothetical protein